MFPSFSRVILLIVGFILAFVLKFCISYIAGLSCFYTSNGYGVIFLRQTITDIFSGAMLPLSFYPKWFQNIAGVLPFQASVYTPTQLFLGRLAGVEAAWAVLQQAAWIIILWIMGNILFHYSVKKITIHGG
jgi:ABC-2 type transport system permease protein